MPLTYAIRKAVTVAPLPKLVKDQPYREEYPSMTQMLAALMRQDHALWQANNKHLYNAFRKAVEVTVVIDFATGKIKLEKDGKSFVQQALKFHVRCEA